MLERRSGCLAKARVIIGAVPGASQRDWHVRYKRSHHYYYYYYLIVVISGLRLQQSIVMMYMYVPRGINKHCTQLHTNMHTMNTKWLVGKFDSRLRI